MSLSIRVLTESPEILTQIEKYFGPFEVFTWMDGIVGSQLEQRYYWGQSSFRVANAFLEWSY